jgi:hypothetical protein
MIHTKAIHEKALPEVATKCRKTTRKKMAYLYENDIGTNKIYIWFPPRGRNVALMSPF